MIYSATGCAEPARSMRMPGSGTLSNARNTAAAANQISAEVRSSFYRSLERDKNDEITERLVKEISEQIEQCLTRMAEVVEIPLG